MRAVGMIEVRGLVALAAGLDAMCKTAAQVECVFIERVSGGYLAAGIRGELAAVQEAHDSSTVAVQKHGELRRAQVYPHLHAEAAALLEQLARPT